MPRLPSGQHVAVDPTPLRELLEGASSSFNAHHIIAIEQVDDLYRWLDVLALCPLDALPPDLRPSARQVDGAPAGLVGTPIGRLADWPAIAGDWSEADRAAFRTFIDERIRPTASDGMGRSVLECREAPIQSATLAGTFANMWRRRPSASGQRRLILACPTSRLGSQAHGRAGGLASMRKCVASGSLPDPNGSTRPCVRCASGSPDVR